MTDEQLEPDAAESEAAQLPPAGGTTEPERRSAPATDALTLDEAARIYGVSLSTLYRRLRRGDFAGAYKVGGVKGTEWRIPAGALEAVGYTPAEPEPATAAQAAPIAPDVSSLLRAVERLTEQLTAERAQLVAAAEDRATAEREREASNVERARLAAELEAARARVVRAEYERDLARRRWWQRKPAPPELPPGL